MVIPKRAAGKYGFVQFGSPADAKAAFDGSKNLTAENGVKLTVVFAKMEKKAVKEVHEKAKKVGPVVPVLITIIEM